VRRLGAWRRRLAVARQGVGSAIADDEDIIVVGGLERVAHYQPVDPVRFEAVQTFEKIRRLDSCRCVYRKSKSERIDDEVRPVWREFMTPDR
jgi:hypothetical protein